MRRLKIRFHHLTIQWYEIHTHPFYFLINFSFFSAALPLSVQHYRISWIFSWITAAIILVAQSSTITQCFSQLFARRIDCALSSAFLSFSIMFKASYFRFSSSWSSYLRRTAAALANNSFMTENVITSQTFSQHPLQACEPYSCLCWSQKPPCSWRSLFCVLRL